MIDKVNGKCLAIVAALVPVDQTLRLLGCRRLGGLVLVKGTQVSTTASSRTVLQLQSPGGTQLLLLLRVVLKEHLILGVEHESATTHFVLGNGETDACLVL